MVSKPSSYIHGQGEDGRHNLDFGSTTKKGNNRGMEFVKWGNYTEMHMTDESQSEEPHNHEVRSGTPPTMTTSVFLVKMASLRGRILQFPLVHRKL